MLIRALIVVLAILNAGVALWWWSRPAPVDAPLPAMSPPEGVPVLTLLTAPLPAPAADPAPQAAAETLAGSRQAAPAAPATPAAVPSVALTPPPAPPRCVSLGVFADRPLLDAAVGKAGALLAATRARALPAVAGGTYRVMLPPAASREVAQAVVQRIVDAGISDYFIIAQGEQANAVALGQYRNRDGAQRRLAQLQAAGFPATIVASEPVQGGWWLDARLVEGASASQARNATGAGQVQSLDCARMR